MGTRTRIAVATHSPVVRATFVEWLEAGGFEPVAIRHVGASERDLEALNFEVLLVDVELMSVGALMRVARYRATPRPVLVVGDADPDAELDAARRGASYLVRPIEREGLVFAVTLALAEERPMRRSARKRIIPLPSLIDGVEARVLDVSPEGVRLGMPPQHRGSLPPRFTLRVPLFNVAVAVQRVWVSTLIGAASQLCCGGALTRNPQRSADAWRSLVELTPALDAAGGQR